MKKNIVFIPTDVCQNNCVYCLNKEPDKVRLFDDVLIRDSSLICKYIKIFSKYTNEMSLTGFEPTLYKDLFKIINFAVNNGMDFINFHTNGVVINEEYIKRLLPYKKYLKVFISIPSAEEKIYNKITRSRNFDKVFEALKLLIKNDFMIFPNLVVCSLNYKNIENTVVILKDIGVKRVLFLYVDTINPDLNVSYSESLPILEKVIGKYSDIKFQAFDIPPCILDDYPILKKIRLSKCPTNNELSIGEKVCITKEQYSPIMCKTLLDICPKCLYYKNKKCAGMISAYLKVYGKEYFKDLDINKINKDYQK